MGLRQREWARGWVVKLKALLGDKCADCGATEDLTFDLKIPRGDYHGRKREWSWRISLYRYEFEHGNLQLLCGKCNSSKKDILVLTGEPIKEPDPF